jgi:hypothetical protein
MTAVSAIEKGQRFGRLTAVAIIEVRPRVYWLFSCACGAPNKRIRADHVVGGRINSCGCLCKKIVSIRCRTHGMSREPMYVIWCNMKRRCEKPSHHAYSRYGGRGINVCDRWRSFENFLEDMGPRPEGLTLERIDNSLGYSKSNCCWATAKQQMRNKRNNRRITGMGETLTLVEWSERLGVSCAVISRRASRGLPLDGQLG